MVGVNFKEPYSFTGYDYVLKVSRSALKTRYSLLKHYYSLFVKNRGVGMVFKPVFFEFPQLFRDNE